jgi:hypothetical protein
MRDENDKNAKAITLDGGKVLTALRARGLTASALCDLAKVSPNTMTRATTDQPISTRSVRRIAEALAKAPVIAGLSELLAS